MKRCMLVLVLVATAAPLTAQRPARAAVASHTPAWLGVSYDVRWVQRGDVCKPEVVVESVVQGSPAERAGLRPGDAITALNGNPDPAARLPMLAASLSPGDSVRIRLLRGTAVREITAVADRRPPRPAALLVEPSGAPPAARSGLLKSGRPVVEVRGDTLVARNLETGGHWVDADGRGYWLVRGDGDAEYRHVTAWSRDPLDRRVSDLLTCADTVRWAPQAVSVARLDLERIQARADSLRLVLARRALAPDPQGRAVQVLRELNERPPQAPELFDLRIEGPGTFIYRFDERLGAGPHAVAGAELSALEPELADYFRGVRDGLLVLRVAEGSPAKRAGLRPGDVITRGDGQPVTSIAQLRGLLDSPDGPPVELRVVRHGRDRAVTIRRD